MMGTEKKFLFPSSFRQKKELPKNSREIAQESHASVKKISSYLISEDFGRFQDL